MSHIKYLFYFIFLHLIIAIPQINLYYTDEVNDYENDDDDVLQHDCLRIIASIEEANIRRQIISYCMSELLSKYHVENNNIFPKFTFAELAERNITSQQLYLWSASIDLIEYYQFYLNQLSISNKLIYEKKIFYNCTLPRFGPMCQYEFDYYHPNHSSLYEIIHDFYHNYEYNPINLTCYTHLKCKRGHLPACLDWSEICDGKVDCLDGEFDEEYCWQLQMNTCKDNEYQCSNGQCIPKSFFLDDSNNPDCLDGSDEPKNIFRVLEGCRTYELSFGCEDRTCEYTPLTSSCVAQRKYLLMETMYSTKDSSVSDECWSAFKCILSVTEHSFDNYLCHEIIQKHCPEMLYIPNVPVLFGHVYTAYARNDSEYMGDWARRSPYICYNNSRYDDLLDKTSRILFNGKTCFRSKTSPSPAMVAMTWDEKYEESLNRLYYVLKKFTKIGNYTFTMCNKLNIYKCINSSECIPLAYIMNGIFDCPYKDDEYIFENNITNNVLEKIRQNYYKCETTNRYIHQNLISNGNCECGYTSYVSCEDEDMNYMYSRRNISFQTICDGFTELLPINFNEQNETDETECEQWECNNIYTRCDGLWNCLNGEDEIGCYLSSSLNCSSRQHLCVSPYINQLICLPIEQVNDGKVDCLGATDEPRLCQSNNYVPFYSKFYCMNQTFELCIGSLHLCDGYKDCDHGDDEQFCEKNQTSSTNDIKKFLIYNTMHKERVPRKYFSLDEISKSIDDHMKNIENAMISRSPIIQLSDQYQPHCHRGLDLRIWLNNKNNLTTNTCLCPPSYSGSKCQYQNQRISLTIKFRALSDSWQTLFAIIILLIDNSNERIIHSYEQFTYLSIRDCKTKYNIYLFYSTRPKDLTKNYSIHIDIYEKVSLIYRGSLLFPINFSFLPVHRLGFIIDIPQSDNKYLNCLNHQCNHGKCIKYSNNLQNLTFCQCEQGWSGRYCNISYNFSCSSDSLSIGISAYNQSICICPIQKFGSRCFINTICQNDTNFPCQNNGQCIPIDEYMITNKKFICICPQGFSGYQCEIIDKKIFLSFEKNLVQSQSMFIHFIKIIKNDIPVRVTTFRTIPIIKNSVNISWSRPFHLMFIELINKTYYLIDVQKNYNRSRTIVKIINSSDRCLHINEIFNETFIKLHLIRRIKYYHLPCQNYSLNLSCFYDNDHICLCYNYNQKRLSNCFDFNHNMIFDCSGQSVCQNNAQCFQDHPDCPQRSMCICPLCFYGRQCQFSTSGFGLSLDAILGYHIIPYNNIKYQPFIVKFSLILTIIFIIIGFINGILALITFKNKIVCEVGCGLYLLSSSIATLFIMILFGFKFSILILAQMTIISNQLFLQIQCISLDFFLQICLNMNEWLNACVACERAITSIKGTKFNKTKSKQAAKLVIPILLIIIICTSIYDPMYRHLIIEENNDDNEKRLWCIVTYPHSFKIYNSFIHTFHFFAPFIINLISAIILITKKSLRQSIFQTHRSFKDILQKQFLQHKHLFTAPIVLSILALPRLIITFRSKCMKSVDDSWLFLIGYFISFIPSMLTFIIFILPSKFYKKEFKKSIIKYRVNIQRRLRFIS